VDAPAADPREMDVQAGMRIATDATFPPFHYIDELGEATGFDIELARELAWRAGYVPEVLVVPYDELFVDLLLGRHDVVAATTGITPEREQTYLFTRPYFDTCQAALVRTGKGEPRSLADLVGRRVGAAGSGTSVLAMDNMPGVIPILLSEREVTEDTISDDGSVPALENGDIDALIVDEMDAVDATRLSNGRLRVLREPVALEQYAMVLAPNNIRMKRALEKALVAMQEDGSLEQLQRDFGLYRGDDWPIDLP